MKEQEVEILKKQIKKLDAEDFDLDAWKTGAIILLERLFGPGNHGSTFGGNPLSCAAGLAVVNELESSRLAERAAELGNTILAGFRQELENIEGIREIRGLGLLIAIELECNCTELVKLALEDGLLINVCSDNTIRLLPALIMSDEEAGLLVDKLTGLIWEFLNSKKDAA